MKFTTALAFFSAASHVIAIPAIEMTANTAAVFEKRAGFPIPPSKGSVTLQRAQIVSGSFDGGLKTYGRGVACVNDGQTSEGQNPDAVFVLNNGATLSNVIIGKDQTEGVHCLGSCTIKNVWWSDVCEDALTLKGTGNANIIGGGAYGAEDKTVQHDGLGTVTIDGFTVMNFGKLYRACGNCKTRGTRKVNVKNVKAYNGKLLVGVNPANGDVATFSNVCATSTKLICAEFQPVNPGQEPPELHSGPSKSCVYSSVPAC